MRFFISFVHRGTICTWNWSIFQKKRASYLNVIHVLYKQTLPKSKNYSSFYMNWTMKKEFFLSRMNMRHAIKKNTYFKKCRMEKSSRLCCVRMNVFSERIKNYFLITNWPQIMIKIFCVLSFLGWNSSLKEA